MSQSTAFNSAMNSLFQYNEVQYMTYIPTAQDLYWTLQNIDQKKSWGIPSAGSIYFFDHSNYRFKVYTIAEKSEKAMNFFTGTYTNLLLLGYTESSRILCPGVKSTKELLVNFFQYSDDEVERAYVKGIEMRPDDPRFDE